MKRFYLVTINVLVAMIASSPQTLAQTVPDVIFYSRLTKSFDRQPPIGEAFQIKGSITRDVMAVKLEGFGFTGSAQDKALINVLIGADRSRPFCEALESARAKNDVLKTFSSWERPEGSQGATLNQFSFNHQRLYYGRSYIFFLTYYTPFNEDEQKKVVADFIRDVIPVVVRTANLRQSMTPADWEGELGSVNASIKSALRNTHLPTCTDQVINKTTLLPVELAEIFNPYLAFETQKIRGQLLYEQALIKVSTGEKGLRDIAQQLRDRLKSITDNISQKNWDLVVADLGLVKSQYPGTSKVITDLKPFLDKASTVTTSQTDQKYFEDNKGEVSKAGYALTSAVDALSSKIANKLWNDARVQVASMQAFFGDKPPGYDLTENLVKSLGDAEYASGEIGGVSIEDVIAQASAAFRFPDYEEMLHATFTEPYFETMEEEQPFIISLDGGLAYVSKFEELVPTIGINFKLNRVDFDDPLTNKPEFSVIMALGMTKPDDLDPDYKGIFGGTGDRSFVVGLGGRFPRISRLLRVQAGTVWYRQSDHNPLIKDYDTKVSFYVGLSLNWDTLDFAANLFRTRSNFNLGL